MKMGNIEELLKNLTSSEVEPCRKSISMNVIREIENITHKELECGIFGGLTKGSWHEKYVNSAWVYIGGMSYELSEGDVICFMSQWGEIEDIHLVRDKDTRKSLGYAFIKYDDQRSTILAVDNFNGIKLLGRTLRCDHVDQYKLPKAIRKQEEEILEDNPEAEMQIGPGHAYKDIPLANDFNVVEGIDLWAKNEGMKRKSSSTDQEQTKKSKKEKKKEKKSKSEKHTTQSTDKGDESHLTTFIDTVASVARKSIASSAPALASWRGNRDPTVAVGVVYSKVAEDGGRSSNSGGDKERRRAAEVSGFGGMNRTR